ncbi:MAG: aspartate/glutamate racemase family protein [Wenzhouxiangella sp.]
MKTIGLLGGMSWESTAIYYRLINQGVRARLGGLHSAAILLHSIDFAPMAALQRDNHWDEAGAKLAAHAAGLEKAGADCLVLCTNTMHRVAETIKSALTIPLIHIADATALRLQALGIQQVGLLGTAFTMEQAFYRDRLAGHGLTVLTPEPDERAIVHRVIFDELCRGRIEPASRQTFIRFGQDLASRGAQAIVMGCTEIGLLLGPDDLDLPLIDTTEVHAEAAVSFALADSARPRA